VPLAAHIKEHPAYFKRFDAIWTPTVIVLDPEGQERRRSEGYLPKDEFRAELEMSLARVAAMSKNWADAEQLYSEVLERFPDSKVAPEALYWEGVSKYKASNDHSVLGEMPGKFKERYPDSEWALKTAAWQH